MVSTYTGYQQTVRDLPRSLEVAASDGFVAREVDYYSENIGNVKSIDDLLEDTRLFNFVMKAHGLEEMNYAKALVRKVFEGGRDDNDAFVNRMADQRYRDLAETFDFKRYDTATTSFTRAQQGTVDKYIRQTLEENLGAQNEGIRLALYFERKAPQIDSVEAILADRALSVVVRQALQIPEATAFLDIDKQVELISEKLDIADFQDPEKLSKFIDRYAFLRDAANPQTSQAGLLFNTGSAFGVSTDLLLTIQTLR